MTNIKKQCLICNIKSNHLIRLNSIEGYMQFRIKNKPKKDIKAGFICFDCREQLRKELEKESDIKID